MFRRFLRRRGITRRLYGQEGREKKATKIVCKRLPDGSWECTVYTGKKRLRRRETFVVKEISCLWGAMLPPTFTLKDDTLTLEYNEDLEVMYYNYPVDTLVYEVVDEKLEVRQDSTEAMEEEAGPAEYEYW